MRIEVTANNDSVSPRIRAYAEYRLFTTLARHARVIRTVGVILRSPDPQAGGALTCEVNVSLQASGSARVLVHGPHLHAAIDSAAERIGYVIARLEAPNGDSV
jgi:ribosome-associated translation inhibitor RaiA